MHVDTIEPHRARCHRTLHCVALMAVAVVAAPTTVSCAAVGGGDSICRRRVGYRRSRSCMPMDG